MNTYQNPTESGGDETTQLLSESLSRLREPRPEFQAELQARLLARLPEASQPWWRLSVLGPSRRTNRSGGIPRRSAILGMAAAAAGVLALASVTIPYSQTQSVSAEEILQKAQALSENPLAAQVRSFHLTARSIGKLGPNGDKPLDLTTEQWFAAPDRMRTETKSRAADGSTVVSGFVSDGQSFRHYQTPGSGDRDVVTMIGVPAMKAVAVDKKAGGEPGEGAEMPKAGVFISRAVRTEKPSPGEGQTQEIKKIDVDKDQVVALKECKQSRKQEEATIAGREAYVVETDFSTCEIEGDPANLPDKMPGKHVAWIDKETYVPLKMEDYARDGKLTHTYEVTSIEYDVSIADSTFKDIPPKGTELREVPMIKLPDKDGEPGVRPAPVPALRGTPVPTPTR